MRCVLCDSNSNGLSYFNIDRPLCTSFHSVNGETFCSECYEGYSEVMTDYYLEDELNELNEEDYAESD